MINKPSSVITGMKVSFTEPCVWPKSHTFMPSAKPAAIAAPKAVVSGIFGRTVKNKFFPQNNF